MNHLISDEAVYRTAPATPGLLNIVREKYTKGVFSLQLPRTKYIRAKTIYREALLSKGKYKSRLCTVIIHKKLKG